MIKANTLCYKGFEGSVEYSWIDGRFIGRALHLEHACISYEGHTIEEIKDAFEAMIDFYLEKRAIK